MRVGIPRETAAGETRVALMPGHVAALAAAGHEVLVERRLGSLLGVPDQAYAAAGARVVPREGVFADADLVVKVEPPSLDEVPLLHEGQTLMAFLDLPARPELRSALAAAGVTALALETVEGRDGGRPLLASQSALAGRLAVTLGAYHLLAPGGGPGSFLGGLTGTAAPKVAVLGVGVAGVGAVRAALGLGARVVAVEADLERVAALDGVFPGPVDLFPGSEETVRSAVAGAQLVVGCAWVRGGTAPLVVGRGVMGLVADGGLVVDVSVRAGGCFETTRPAALGEPPYVEEGVRHLCAPNLAAAAGLTATGLLAERLLPLVMRVAEDGVHKASSQDPGIARALAPR